jgi:hypothetical protein
LDSREHPWVVFGGFLASPVVGFVVSAVAGYTCTRMVQGVCVDHGFVVNQEAGVLVTLMGWAVTAFGVAATETDTFVSILFAVGGVVCSGIVIAALL